MENNEKFEKALQARKAQLQNIETKIEKLKQKLIDTPQNSMAYDVYTQQLIDTQNFFEKVKSIVEFMRPNNEVDNLARQKIYRNYTMAVKQLFTTDYPIVFHGTNNIGIVRQILKSGGLLTPEQRSVSMTSFASAIDVTYKNNISVSCQFADAGPGSFMPYGAIFAFKPQDNELERVYSTSNGTEVPQGVDGVNFVDEPQRLYNIITTPENIEQVKDWCKQYKINPNKVVTHNQFLEEFKTKLEHEEMQI